MGVTLFGFVVADQADVDSHEQGEDEGLNQADQQLQKIKWNG